MAQFARPIADVQDGSWSSTPFWSKIDEDIGGGGDDVTIASDAVGNNVTTSDLDLEATNTGLIDPEVSVDHILRVLWSSSITRDMTGHFELWQGIPDVGTLIAEATVELVNATEVETAYTLTGTETDNITDYNDLYFTLWGFGSGGGPNRSLVVDAIEFEIPGGQITDEIFGSMDVSSTATATPNQIHTVDSSSDASSTASSIGASQIHNVVAAPDASSTAAGTLTVIALIEVTGEASATSSAVGSASQVHEAVVSVSSVSAVSSSPSQIQSLQRGRARSTSSIASSLDVLVKLTGASDASVEASGAASQVHEAVVDVSAVSTVAGLLTRKGTIKVSGVVSATSTATSSPSQIQSLSGAASASSFTGTPDGVGAEIAAETWGTGSGSGWNTGQGADFTWINQFIRGSAATTIVGGEGLADTMLFSTSHVAPYIFTETGRDLEVLFEFTVAGVDASSGIGALLRRQGGSADFYTLGIGNRTVFGIFGNEITVDGKAIIKTVSGGRTLLAESAATITNGDWWIRARIIGNDLKVKVWQGTEPGPWDLEVTDSEFPSTGEFGIVFAGVDFVSYSFSEYTATEASRGGTRLTQIHTVDAASSATSSATGSLLEFEELDGAVSATSTALGSPSQIQSLSGSSSATSSLTARVFVPGLNEVTGSSDNSSTTSAALLVKAIRQLSGAMSAVSAVSATPAQVHQAIGASSAVSATAGSVDAIDHATGASSSVSQVAGSASQVHKVTAATDAVSTVQGTPSQTLNLQAAASATSSVLGDVTTAATVQVTGASSATSSASGVVTEKLSLSASSRVVSSFSAQLIQVHHVRGDASATSQSSARPVQLHQLIGEAMAVSQNSVVLFVGVLIGGKADITLTEASVTGVTCNEEAVLALATSET